MKKIINYFKNFTLKTPCDNCIVVAKCQEVHCSIEDEYFDKQESISNTFYKLTITGLFVILVIQLAGWYFNGSVPKGSGYWLSFLQCNQIFWQCRLILISRTKLLSFKRRHREMLQKIENSHYTFSMYKSRTP
jgi:hypothetical protein